MVRVGFVLAAFDIRNRGYVYAKMVGAMEMMSGGIYK
jgi:hypothetical protein